jgi:hypothetical protein
MARIHYERRILLILFALILLAGCYYLAWVCTSAYIDFCLTNGFTERLTPLRFLAAFAGGIFWPVFWLGYGGWLSLRLRPGL